MSAALRSALVFGSAITSSRHNGAAVFFRGLCRALARTGLTVTFAEQSQPVEPDEGIPAGIRVQRYKMPADVREIMAETEPPRLLVKFVACGTLDAAVERVLLFQREASDVAVFVDGDAPASLESIRLSPEHPSRATLSRFDGVLVLAGGEAAAAQFLSFGARRVRWGYCGVDERFWRPVPPSVDLVCDLLFAGNRLADREARVREFFLRPASLCPDRRFLLAGSGWEEAYLPANVRVLGHLRPAELRRAYASAGLVLNVNREPMARYGYAPASRLFEAAACGAGIVSDRWPGIEAILAPGEEVLLADGAADVVRAVREVAPALRRRIGLAARRRIERDYTCDGWVRWLLATLAEWGLVDALSVVGAEREDD